ncbi:MAG: hypothetical protein ABIA47_04400 [bacterium]
MKKNFINSGRCRLAGVFFLVILILSSLALLWQNQFDHTGPELGVTFSTLHAEELAGNWADVYWATVDELGVRNLRVPVYWSEVESVQGEYDFSGLNWIMNEAEAHGASVTLAVGVKVPRWPECFIPEWAADLSREDQRAVAVEFVKEVVGQYKDHPALARWQVENEPLFYFGECPFPDLLRVAEETDAVRNLDPDHPILSTTSGEQGIWVFRSSAIDEIGASLYRMVWNDLLGYLAFPYRPEFYAIQRIVASALVQKVIISELQAEPWIYGELMDASVDEQYEAFTAEDLIDNVEFARRTGVDEIFLWGVEWWYYLRLEGDDRLWSAAMELFKQK